MSGIIFLTDAEKKEAEHSATERVADLQEEIKQSMRRAFINVSDEDANGEAITEAQIFYTKAFAKWDKRVSKYLSQGNDRKADIASRKVLMALHAREFCKKKVAVKPKRIGMH